jgi:pimeloyl-ACP methyl ester carboxylesterase
MVGTEKSFDTGEVVLNYFEGPKAGPPLLLLHGLSARHQNYEPFFTPFLSEWHVIAFDMRGHGSSGKTPGHYRLTDYARDILTFIRERCAEPVALVGHSMGALAIFEVASQLPEKVRAIVSMDPPLFLRDHLLEFDDWVYQAIKHNAELKQAALFSQPGETLFQELPMTIAQVDLDALITMLQNQLLTNWDIKRALQQVMAPVMLVYGDWDHNSVVRDEDVQYIKATLPQILVEKILDGNHFFPMHQTQLTVEIVHRFLRTVYCP